MAKKWHSEDSGEKVSDQSQNIFIHMALIFSNMVMLMEVMRWRDWSWRSRWGWTLIDLPPAHCLEEPETFNTMSEQKVTTKCSWTRPPAHLQDRKSHPPPCAAILLLMSLCRAVKQLPVILYLRQLGRATVYVKTAAELKSLRVSSQNMSSTVTSLYFLIFEKLSTN